MLTIIYIAIAAVIVLGPYCRLLVLRKGDTPYCGRCGYNLTGLTSDRCPECGGLLSEMRVVRGELVIGRSTRLWYAVSILLLLAVAVALAIKW
jgi:hypothetical protein